MTASIAPLPLSRSHSSVLFHGMVLLSGFAGLGYQMLWSRMLAVSLGHEIVAVLAVVAAFFTGLSLGAFVLNGRLLRTRHPARWYAGMELLIALWALVLLWVLPDYNRWMPTLIGAEPSPWRHWSIAFGSALFLLLPATAAMGATLPALERMYQARGQGNGAVAGLYASNTFGAVLGTLLSTFVLIPAWGHTHSLLVLTVSNVLCAAASLTLFRQSVTATVKAAPAPAADDPRRRLLLTLFCTGFLGIGYEIVMVRLLSQVLENTVYTFASILAVYLLGTAAGAAWYHWREGRLPLQPAHWQHRLALLLSLTAASLVLGIMALLFSDRLYQLVLNLGQPDRRLAIAGELLVGAAVFLLPTLCMGALFSHLARLALITTGLGKALGVNTLGAALAPICVGVLLLPALGANTVIALIILGYLLWLPHLTPSALAISIPTALAALAFWLGPPIRFISVAEDTDVVAYEDGVMTAVAVVQDPSGHRHLKVNNHFTMGGTATRFSDHRQSHLPLLLHGAPSSALYLGLGTGITFEAAQFYRGMQTTGVDLIPETLHMMPWFDVKPTPAQWQPMPHLLAADARRFVLSTPERYDVIIAEIFHPSRDGAGSLYTVEQFDAIRQRLAPGGLFAQWLPLFQLDLTTLQTIVRTFLQVYPQAQLHLGHFSLQQPILCLIGGDGGKTFSSDWLQERVLDPRLQQELVQERLNSDFALFGGYLAGANALQTFAGGGPINSDDHPVVTYAAPDFVYGQPALPAQRLLQLIQQLDPTRDPLLANTENNRNFAAQLQRYWQARDLFLQAGAGIDPDADIGAMVAATRQPLLDAIRISPEFEPAYRALMGTAQALAQVDRYGAYQLLSDLDDANPQRADARQLRLALFGN